MTNVETTHYVFGTGAGPHPFPAMVRDFQRVIGDEAREQVLERDGRLPDAVVRLRRRRLQRDRHLHRVRPRRRRAAVRLRGRRRRRGRPAGTRPRITGGAAGVLHGARSYLLQDEDGQTMESHSISRRPGLPGRRPGARLAARHRPGRVPAGHRRRGDGGVRAALPHRGHHPGDRVRARLRRRAADRARARRRARPRSRSILRQPLRPRRQGHGHRGPSEFGLRRRRHVDRGGGPARGDRLAETLADRPAPRAGPRWSATCRPATPTSRASIAAMAAMVEGGVDVVEVGLPYSDPVHGRAVDPGRPSTRRWPPASAPPTCCAPSRRSPPTGAAAVVMTLLEPDRALRRRRGSPPTSPRPGEPG